MSRRRLIVSGDDFGVAPEVNAGIVQAHVDGVLTSTSLMVTGAAVDEAVELAHRHPGLAVGLHLVLAQGVPAAPPEIIPDLVRPAGRVGDRPGAPALGYAAAWVWGDGRAQLRREIEAQLAAFRATGLALSHVDGHCNMHLHPMVLAVLLELAGPWSIRAIRLTRDPLGPALRHDRRHPVRKTAEATIFRALAAWAAPRLEAAGIVTVDRVIGMHQTGQVDERYLLATIASLGPGTTEIYCHPSLGTAPAMAPYQPGYRGADEVAGLTSPRVRAALEAAGIELGTYPDLTCAQAAVSPTSR